MENNNPLISSYVNEQTMDDSPEESTWTFYMQDFQNGNSNDDHQESAGVDDDLVVSDAFSSSSGRKLLQGGDHDSTGVVVAAAAAAFTSARSINGRKLRRKPNVGDDHDLQDTASSPAHSPKVTYFNQGLNLDQIEKDGMNVTEGNNNGRKNSATTDQQVVSNDTDEDDENKQQSELKKRGLCLVPVSMLRNHFI